MAKGVIQFGNRIRDSQWWILLLLLRSLQTRLKLIAYRYKFQFLSGLLCAAINFVPYCLRII